VRAIAAVVPSVVELVEDGIERVVRLGIGVEVDDVDDGLGVSGLLLGRDARLLERSLPFWRKALES
jgi:hypothetical protein